LHMDACSWTYAVSMSFFSHFCLEKLMDSAALLSN
jgi:hypothetical protein